MTRIFEIGIFPIVLTLCAFQVGKLCQRKWKLPIFNPTLIGMVLVVIFLLVTGMDTGVYAEGTAKMSWLMTPATISLAIPMYEQFQILRKNLAAIAAGVAAGAVSCLTFLTAGCILVKLDRTLAISILPKSVTTAIGVPLGELFGGLGGVTTASIIVTGIFAVMVGPALLKLFRITDPVAQGVAYGTAAHVIGTTKASEMSELSGAVSSLSLVVAGVLTAILFPIATGLL